jgi:hypothetical protein
MKTTKGLILSLVMMAMILTWVQQAEAARGSQVGADGESVIEVFPNAPGTKYSGPLTIYYIQDPYMAGYYFMHFFMRLRKGVSLYSFSGVTEMSYDYTSDTEGQQEAIRNFIQYTAIPILYPGELPTALVKSVDMVVEDNEFEYDGCCEDPDGETMYFIIMDVVIAVQD